MGRRSMWYYLGDNPEEAEKKLEKAMSYVKNHNSDSSKDRGEDIDDAFYQTYKGKKDIWLILYSGGGDWATYEYFQTKYPDFGEKLMRYDDYASLKDYYSDEKLWEYKSIDLKKYEIRTMYDGVI